MDRRDRKYYLVTFNHSAYQMRMDYIKTCCESRKVHAVKKHLSDKYKGYWQVLISCRNEESEALEYELRKAIRNDGYNTKFIEI